MNQDSFIVRQSTIDGLDAGSVVEADIRRDHYAVDDMAATFAAMSPVYTVQPLSITIPHVPTTSHIFEQNYNRITRICASVPAIPCYAIAYHQVQRYVALLSPYYAQSLSDVIRGLLSQGDLVAAETRATETAISYLDIFIRQQEKVERGELNQSITCFSRRVDDIRLDEAGELRVQYWHDISTETVETYRVELRRFARLWQRMFLHDAWKIDSVITSDLSWQLSSDAPLQFGTLSVGLRALLSLYPQQDATSTIESYTGLQDALKQWLKLLHLDINLLIDQQPHELETFAGYLDEDKSHPALRAAIQADLLMRRFHSSGNAPHTLFRERADTMDALRESQSTQHPAMFQDVDDTSASAQQNEIIRQLTAGNYAEAGSVLALYSLNSFETSFESMIFTRFIEQVSTILRFAVDIDRLASRQMTYIYRCYRLFLSYSVVSDYPAVTQFLHDLFLSKLSALAGQLRVIADERVFSSIVDFYTGYTFLSHIVADREFLGQLDRSHGSLITEVTRTINSNRVVFETTYRLARLLNDITLTRVLFDSFRSPSQKMIGQNAELFRCTHELMNLDVSLEELFAVPEDTVEKWRLLVDDALLASQEYADISSSVAQQNREMNDKLASLEEALLSISQSIGSSPDLVVTSIESLDRAIRQIRGQLVDQEGIIDQLNTQRVMTMETSLHQIQQSIDTLTQVHLAQHSYEASNLAQTLTWLEQNQSVSSHTEALAAIDNLVYIVRQCRVDVFNDVLYQRVMTLFDHYCERFEQAYLALSRNEKRSLSELSGQTTDTLRQSFAVLRDELRRRHDAWAMIGSSESGLPVLSQPLLRSAPAARVSSGTSVGTSVGTSDKETSHDTEADPVPNEEAADS